MVQIATPLVVAPVPRGFVASSLGRPAEDESDSSIAGENPLPGAVGSHCGVGDQTRPPAGGVSGRRARGEERGSTHRLNVTPACPEPREVLRGVLGRAWSEWNSATFQRAPRLTGRGKRVRYQLGAHVLDDPIPPTGGRKQSITAVVQRQIGAVVRPESASSRATRGVIRR